MFCIMQCVIVYDLTFANPMHVSKGITLVRMLDLCGGMNVCADQKNLKKRKKLTHRGSQFIKNGETDFNNMKKTRFRSC